jgi:two-component system sensor histidine kinase EvgS
VGPQLRLLFIEDSEDDVFLLVREVRRAGYDLVHQRVETEEALRAALESAEWDVILCDYNLPRFGALQALAITREGERDIPFILVSGSVTDEAAVDALKAGAHDFVMKHRLTRLVPAIRREMQEAAIRKDRKRALQALELAVKARDEFLTLASHELMTPLTPLELQVTAAMRLVRAKGCDENGLGQDVAERLGSASRQIGKLTAVINNLIDATKIDSGRFETDRHRADLREIVNAIVGRWTGLLAMRRVSITVDGPDEIEGDWDSRVVESILSNLISNAIKFGNGKPVEVKLRCTSDEAEISVRDHGIGIEQGAHERIFERFERAVSAAHYGGMGIGLWIARAAARAHGGDVRVASHPGKGATFALRLPRWREMAAAVPVRVERELSAGHS